MSAYFVRKWTKYKVLKIGVSRAISSAWSRVFRGFEHPEALAVGEREPNELAGNAVRVPGESPFDAGRRPSLPAEAHAQLVGGVVLPALCADVLAQHPVRRAHDLDHLRLPDDR